MGNHTNVSLSLSVMEESDMLENVERYSLAILILFSSAVSSACLAPASWKERGEKVLNW